MSDQEKDKRRTDVVSLHAEVLKELGKRIRAKRLECGETLQVAFEIRAGYGVKIDPSSLSKIECGKTETTMRTLFAIAGFYGTSVSDLTEGMQVKRRGE